MANRAARPRRAPAGFLTALATVTLLVGAVPALPAAAAPAVPPGWRLVASETLGPGVEHQILRSDDPPEDVHVARLAPGTAGRLAPVLAHDVLAAPEPTSSMCARVRCVAAVNGDFFDGAGRPIGAMVAGGQLLTSPATDHILLRIDGQGRATLRPGIDWSAAAITPDGRTVPVAAVNRPLAGEGTHLYSRRWGAATGSDPGTTEVALQLLPGGILPTGDTAVRVSPATTGGNAPIAPNQVVLAARGAGAAALADLAKQSAATLRVSVGGIVSAIGGSPQLLENGRVDYPATAPDDFTQGRHPRTVVGLTPAGEVLLVTADGSPTSAGLTLGETTRLLAGLGATDALNLDGGGSTTFVANGTVRNAPAAGAERPVASSLAVVTADPVADLLSQVDALVNALLKPGG